MSSRTRPSRTIGKAEALVLFDLLAGSGEGRAVLRLRLYVLKGTVKDAWDTVAKCDRSGHA